MRVKWKEKTETKLSFTSFSEFNKYIEFIILKPEIYDKIILYQLPQYFSRK